MKNHNKIVIKGARHHNLKNIDVDIPKNKLVVITGLSGSGKSTLAFDTIYAEGQRRYVESLSSYARQFLGQMEKPDVDSIEGLSPAIAIEQKTTSHNPRSTVGTITEIYDYLRLLYARIGKAYCYKCGKLLSSQSVDQIIDKIMLVPENSKIIIYAPVVLRQKGTFEKLFKDFKKDGFTRFRVDGEAYRVEELPTLDKNKKHNIDITIDRVVVKKDARKRITDSIELALKKSNGLVSVEVLKDKNNKETKEYLFNENAACTECGVNYPEFTPASFSFNSPQGACMACDGLGTRDEFDPKLIVPDENLSLREGAVVLWANRNSMQFIEFIEALTSHFGVDIYTPYKDLPDNFKQVLLYGTKRDKIEFFLETKERKIKYKRTYEGIIPNLKRRYVETTSSYSRNEIAKFMSFKPCMECGGARLSKASLSVKINGLNIYEFTNLSISSSLEFIDSLKLNDKDKLIAKSILKEIKERLNFLKNVGLEYLTLARNATTLSGGENQRIRLATQIGSKLTGVLYVLDEPSIGLHYKDNKKLLNALLKMRDLGNSVIVVEHDENTIKNADYIIDMGPLAGVKGGEVVAKGTYKEILKSKQSLTALYLSGVKKIDVPKKRRKPTGKLVIKKASVNNLKNIDITFPLGVFTCVTGVSGSGKSSIVIETLYKALARYIYKSKPVPGSFETIEGLKNIDKVINIDQSPIGRTPRSNPGTYTGAFTFIREFFAQTKDAKASGYMPGRFSFNVKGGRCEACQGDGIIKIEMHFLPDIYVVCDVCGGKRYNKETLSIKYKDKNINDVLNMTINQASSFFENIPQIKKKLDTLISVGLGYIKLGQQATTLSGGEAQRIKLARELSKTHTTKTLYILDEPTTGLHTDDIKKLLSVLDKLVDSGNTVVVIEHNLDVIKYADHIIDIGPEGGDKGGMIIACGSPEDIAKNSKSYTGKAIKKIL